MAEFIGKSKGFGEAANSITFNTLVPELEDDANIQNAFELFYFGDSSVGTDYDTTNSLYAHLLSFDSRITSATTTVNGLVSTIGLGNVVVGTGTSQTLTNKNINLLNNTLSGTVAQFNTALSDDNFATISGIETLTNKTFTTPKINENVILTATSTELNVLDGITSSTAELNIMDGVTASAAEINILDGATLTTSELNVLDGITSTTTELNYVDGVTSAIQTQLDSKSPLISPTFTGTVVLPSTTSIGNVSSTEIGYIDGVTSSIQTQINLKPTLTYEGNVVNRNIFVQASQPTAANIGDIWFDF
jgi:hypothetical protein